MTASTLTAKYPTSRIPAIDYSHAPYFVRSKSTPNLSYMVATTTRGVLACQCPAQMNPKSRGQCWHIKAVAAGIIRPAAWRTPAPSRPLPPMTADHSRPVSCDDLY